MVGWHHRLSGMSLSKLQEMVKDGEGSLVCSSPWGCKELDRTEQMNNKKLYNICPSNLAYFT